MGRACVISLWLLAVGALGCAQAAGGVSGYVSGGDPEPPAADALLAVPYIPQSGELCGGAALAMVLRHWGEPRVLAEDFADLLAPERDGIPTAALVAAARRGRGWDAWELDGNPEMAREHLADGRPLIALVRARGGTFHYVVLVGWSSGRVTYHDPGDGPFRSQAAPAFVAAWAGSGYWLLLVAPAPGRETGKPAATVATDTTPPSPLVLLASARFRAGDWSGAGDLAEQALVTAPEDRTARRLLAGSRYLAGDIDGALVAWNHLGEPRADLLLLSGAAHIRYATVATRLDLPPGRLVTPAAFRRARRRLADVPAVQAFRLELRPRAGGLADIDAALLERPLVDTSALGAVAAAARAVVHQEVVVNVANPTGNGELWTASWRWQAARRRLALGLAMPVGGRHAGLWRVEASRDEQTYLVTSPTRELRRRSSLSRGDWVTADLRVEAAAALDTWDGRGDFVSLGGGVRSQSAHDAWTFDAAATAWFGAGEAETFTTVALGVAWRPPAIATTTAWLVDAGLSRASDAAPLALWNGAGTGEGREPLLRAHPLLRRGVVEGPVFGRSLAHLTIERRAWVWRAGPLQCGWAVFVDAAGADRTGCGSTGSERKGAWQADVGAGLRVRLPGLGGGWRVDVARGLVDGHVAVSIAQQLRR